jgi:hypothetical protein
MDPIDFRCSYCKLQVLYIFVNVRIIDLDKYHDCVDPNLVILVIKVK